MASIRSKLLSGVARKAMKNKLGASGSVEKERANLDKMAGLMGRRKAGANATVGGVPGEWQNPAVGDSGKVVLYLHGGGYALGSPASHRTLAGCLADLSYCRTFIADYRLGPEHPFPAAVEDGVAAYKGLLDEGHEPGQIFIAGDSAGGGLTVAILVSAKAQGLPLPAAGICISPWVDLTLSSHSMASMAEADPMVTPGALAWMAGLYLDGQDAKAPLASPIFADLSGLPPLLIQVGSEEILYDDAIALNKIAKEAGVEVTLEVWEGMMHVWHLMVGVLPEARQAIRGISAFIAGK
ncbi:MAG: alpha/beta hydrolase [Porticoccaceae bacterium]